MEIGFAEVAYCILLGGSVGLAQSLLGIGGGILMVPLLPLAFGLEPRQAVATSLTVMAPVALLNAVQVLLKKQMSVKRVIRLASCSMIGGALAALATGAVEPRILVLTFGVVTLWMGVSALRRRSLGKVDISDSWDYPAGFGAGLVGGFTGLSGGVILVPYLNAIQSLPNPNVVPTSIGVLALTSLAGAVTFAIETSRGVTAANGEALVSYMHTGIMILSALTVSYFGLRYQSRVSHRFRLAVVGTLLLGLSARSLYQALLM